MNSLIIDQLPTLENIYIRYTIEVWNYQLWFHFDSCRKRHLRRISWVIVGSKLRRESFLWKRIFFEGLMIQFMAIESIWSPLEGWLRMWLVLLYIDSAVLLHVLVNSVKVPR